MELMAVVVIVGILATLATYGVRKYILSSKSTEAVHMIGSIKAAQEAWRDETFKYLPVSGNLDSVYPQPDVDSVGSTKYSWIQPGHADVARWSLLNIETNQFVRYGYSCVAGSSGDALPNKTSLKIEDADPFNGVTPTAEWYVIRAIGDLDDDGSVYSTFVSSSFASEIYSERENE